MKNDISKTIISVIVDHTENTTTVKMSGEKTLLSFVQSVSQEAYLSALRDAAFYLLDRAAYCEWLQDADRKCDVQKQVEKMLNEHRAFNE